MVVIVVIILQCWLWPRLSTSPIAELAWSIYFFLLSLRTSSLLTGSAFSLSLYLRVLSLLDISASLWQEMQDKDFLICTVWQTIKYGRMKYKIDKWIIYNIIFFSIKPFKYINIHVNKVNVIWCDRCVTWCDLENQSHHMTQCHTIWHSDQLS